MSKSGSFWMRITSIPSAARAVLMVAAIGLPQIANASEPWVDARMPVTQGLVVWLDAETLNEARHAAALEPLQEGDPLDVWSNGADARHSFVQPSDDAQPTYRTKDSFRAVHFESGYLAGNLRLLKRERDLGRRCRAVLFQQQPQFASVCIISPSTGELPRQRGRS